MTLQTPAPRWLIALLVIPAFVAVDTVGLHLFRALAGDWTGWPRIAALGVLGYGLYLLVPLLLGAGLFGPRKAFAALGLTASPIKGLAAAFAATLILPIGYALTNALAPPAGLAEDIFRSALLPGFAEEVLYRAFLFGFLFRFAGWGFLPAVLLNALLFGGAHLYQGNGLIESLGVFAITGLGAVFFAWFYAEWRFNLWVPIGLHVLMNLWWTLFAMDDTALGPAFTIALRFAALGLGIALTLVVFRRQGRMVRGKAWLWGGPQDGPAPVAPPPPAP